VYLFLNAGTSDRLDIPIGLMRVLSKDFPGLAFLALNGKGKSDRRPLMDRRLSSREMEGFKEIVPPGVPA